MDLHDTYLLACYLSRLFFAVSGTSQLGYLRLRELPICIKKTQKTNRLTTLMHVN
nr:MAG TPA_asm: hypothetical protein [Caudoviricetes sp.]